jgi:hypothetical protein
MDMRNDPPRPSRHASVRAQARGIPLRIVNAILAHADCRRFVCGGRRALMVSRRRLGALAGAVPAADRERMEGVTLIINRTGEVIVTVLHACGPRGRRYRRHNRGRSHGSPIHKKNYGNGRSCNVQPAAHSITTTFSPGDST